MAMLADQCECEQNQEIEKKKKPEPCPGAEKIVKYEI